MRNLLLILLLSIYALAFSQGNDATYTYSYSGKVLVKDTLKANKGIILPAGAGNGKVLTSDAVGKASWSTVVGTTGATGPTGAGGNDGATGPTGATGAAGSNGTNGTNGVTGPTGAAGSNGSNGSNGATGATGPTGAAGSNGSNGSNGATGATGPTGAAGSNGTNGTNGATGATGPTGAAGSNGTNGSNGATGATGPTGATATNTYTVLCQSTTDYSVTGTTTETLLIYDSIPANTVSVGDMLEIVFRAKKTSTNGSFVPNFRIHTSPTLAGNLVYSNTIANTTLWVPFSKVGLVKSSTNTEFGNQGYGADAWIATVSTVAVASYNIDWTQKQYVVYSIKLNSSSDVGYISGYRVTLTKK